MANPEHLHILEKGVDAWNRWRHENPDIVPDLVGASFQEVDLQLVDLSYAGLRGAKFDKANLGGANLKGADINMAYFSEANFHFSNLERARIVGTALNGAKFQLTDFSQTWLNGVGLKDSDFTHARFCATAFLGVDLSGARGLESAQHFGPTFVDINTIYYSKGNIPEVFLQKAGIPDNFIEYMSSMTAKAFEYHSCFISYSGKDEKFAERLHSELQNMGVKCWFAPEDMKIGDAIRQRIDLSIQSHDKLLLVLSKNSIKSNWVEDECETAYERESREQKIVLFPVRIDDAVMDTDRAWAAKLRRSRHIGDFTNWKNRAAYQKAFDRLLRDLKAERGKNES